MSPATGAGNYYDVIAQRLDVERHILSAHWLERLNELLTVERNDVFPSDQLLDHIPALIGQIASYVAAPSNEEIAANTRVIDKARELGSLRHAQHASVHQLLREYEILGEILEAFVVDDTTRLGLQPTPAECFDVLRRINHAVRTLMRTTVDTFITEYTTTIEERNERIHTFNRMASHELRSPIGTILFGAAMLGTEDVRADGERLSRTAQIIRQNAERLSWLVSNLQRLTRTTDFLEAPSHQAIELAVVAKEVARQLDEMAVARGVSVQVSSDLPLLLLDPASLELVLLNLVSNAIKYSDNSKPAPTVEISAYSDDVPAGFCAVQVRDNGLGIPPEAQPGIFERFFRAHAHLDGELKVTGTGLGLAIVADCVHTMGGSIRCVSVPGEGTTFVISLPDSREAAAATLPPLASV